MLQDLVIRQTHALERARTTLAPMVTQKQQALVKMRFDLEKIQHGLEMLRKDRAGMTIGA